MSDRHHVVPDSIRLTDMLARPNRASGAPEGDLLHQMAELGIMFDAAGTPSAHAQSGELRVGLIDCYRFSQECLSKAFASLHPRLAIIPAASIEDLRGAGLANLDLIIYHAHATEGSEGAIAQTIASIRQAFDAVPLIVLSDAEDAQQPKTIRSTLRSGAHGFIPTRTAGIAITFAAIRFVKAGGTFAPLDMLLSNRPDRAPPASEPERQNRLTSRQMAVLSHLLQGKANKIIAHELSMSESTVKVHVRNIMRKIGATNRTQAAYKAQKLWGGTEFAKALEF